MKTYCCNPFNEPGHKANRRDSTAPKRLVSADSAANALQIGVCLTAGVSKICDACHREINRRFEAHQNDRERQQVIDQDEQRSTLRTQRVDREPKQEKNEKTNE